MRRALALALLLASSRALAGPVGAGDPQAAAATGFPGAFMGSFALSLADNARYGSRLLDALDEHLQAVGVMTGSREISDYLEQSAGGSDGVNVMRAALGHEPVDPVKAGALLLAGALARPEQFREIVEQLESAKPGVGRHASELLRAARGTGDKKLFAALHAAGGPRLGDASKPYYAGGRLASIFDASMSAGPDGIVLEDPAAAARAEASGARTRPRALDLSRSARP